MNIVFLGIDLAKNVFQLCGLNQAGKPVYTKRTGRKELLQTLANIPACLIGIEASTGAFYWQREFEKLGHKVKVISPQYVKPFGVSLEIENYCTLRLFFNLFYFNGPQPKNLTGSRYPVAFPYIVVCQIDVFLA